MKFKKIFIQNFMSVGEEPIEVNFDDYLDNRIVTISGINKDVGNLSSNGAGKSLLQEAIVFALFDKSIRGMSKEECINNSTKKKLLIELYVDDLKIIKKRKPNKFQVFKDPRGVFGEETEITESTMARTQDLLENIIGINYKTFVNTCCFGQHNLVSFLSADAASRRSVVENLLKLSEFNQYERKTRDHALELKSEIKDLTRQYQTQNANIEKKRAQLKQYLNQQENYEDQIQKEIDSLEKELKSIEKVDIEEYLSQWKEYEEAQKNKAKIQNELNQILQEASKMEKDFYKQIEEIKKKILPIMEEIKSIDKDLKNIENLKPGVRCQSCYQEVDPENYPSLVSDLNKKKNELSSSLEEPKKRLIEIQDRKKETLNALSNLRIKKQKEYSELNKIKVPSKSKEFLLNIQNKLKTIRKSIKEKKEDLKTNPYIHIVEDLEKEFESLEAQRREIKSDLNEKEKILPYYDFWIKGFGEKGIKSFVIEQIIPVLNQQVNYWMQFFIHNKIIVEFDKFLEIKISRSNGEPVFYNQSSGGERKRIDLAISLAFAHIMRLRSSVEINILFLDELAESIDTDGIEGLDRSLKELGKDRTIFIITHRQNLLDRLSKHKKITIVKEGGFSKILESD